MTILYVSKLAETVRLFGTGQEPSVALDRWGTERPILLSLDTAERALPTLQDGKYRWSGSQQGLDIWQVGENIEAEVVLFSRPASNNIDLKIESRGLVFHPQPALSLKELAEGYYRPENVIDSLAVYHDTQSKFFKSLTEGTKYRAGKAFHIYRIRARDSKSNWTWGKQEVIGSTYRVTLPEDWLLKASYPVYIDPTFGYETLGASSVGANDRIFGSMGTSAAAGTGTSITSGLSSSVAVNWKGLLYVHDGDATNDLLANGVTDQGSVNNATKDWYTLNFTVAPTIAATTDYVPSSYSDNGMSVWYDTVGGGSAGHALTSGLTYPTVPDPITWSTNSSSNHTSDYCTYAESGGATPQAVGDGAVTTGGALGLKTMLGIGTGSLTPSGVLGRKIFLGAGAGSISPAGALKLKTGLQMGNGSIAISGALNRLTKIATGGALAIAGALGLKTLISTGSGSLGISGALAAVKVGAVVIAQAVGDGAVAIAASLGLKTLLSPGAGAVTSTGLVNIKVAIGVGGAMAVAAILGRLIRISSGGNSLGISGALGRLTRMSFGGTLGAAGALNRKTLLAPGGGTVSPTATLGRTIRLTLSGAVTSAGTLGRHIYRTAGGGTVAAIGALNRLTKLSVGAGAVAMAAGATCQFVLDVGGGAVAVAGALGRKIKLGVGGILSAAGNVSTPFGPRGFVIRRRRR